jgi:hypothetical protein
MDTFLKDIRLQPQRYRAIADYCWEHHSYFANERSQILEELKHTLSINTRAFSFQKWHRIVSHKYTLDPLSAKGSVCSSPGGRFNIGRIGKQLLTKVRSFMVRCLNVLNNSHIRLIYCSPYRFGRNGNPCDISTGIAVGMGTETTRRTGETMLLATS